MKQFSLITRVCLWVVRIAIFIIPIGGIYSIYGIYKLSEKGERPEAMEGVLHWSSTNISVGIDRYVLSGITEYTEESGFSDYVELKTPFPRVTNSGFEPGPEDIRIVNKGSHEVEAVMQDSYYVPVSYRIYGSSEIRSVQLLFLLMVLFRVAVAILILVVLRKLLLSMAMGNFFNRANYRRLIILSIPFILIPFIKYLEDIMSNRFFTSNFQILNGGSYNIPYPDFTMVIFGVIFVLMAGMVYEGTKLREEQDLTI